MYLEAVFNPADRTAYNSEATEFVGKKIAVQEGWIIEDGPHKGQPCYYAPSTTIGQIPQSDLTDLKTIPYARWKQIYNSTEFGNK